MIPRWDITVYDGRTGEDVLVIPDWFWYGFTTFAVLAAIWS